jgi:hypothetical protein
MPVKRLKVAILLLDLPCSALVTHSSEVLTIGKSHKEAFKVRFPISSKTVIHDKV